MLYTQSASNAVYSPLYNSKSGKAAIEDIVHFNFKLKIKSQNLNVDVGWFTL